MSTSDAPAPLVGRTTLTTADGVALMKVSNARLGVLNQPRLLAYCAEVAIIAAASAVVGYRLAGETLLAIAVVLFGLAIWAGKRTTRLIAKDIGHGQEGEIALDDEGVTVRQPGLTTHYMWSRFESAAEAPDHIALVTGVGAVLVFARSFDADTFARVRALVSSKLSPSRLP